jgi:hypothetical protein
MLDEGIYTSVSEIGDGEDKSYVSRILRLALLAPDIVEVILIGRAHHALVLESLERPPLASWEEHQAAGLNGLPPAGRHLSGASLPVSSSGVVAAGDWRDRALKPPQPAGGVIDRARREKLVQLLYPGGVLLGDGPRALGDRAAFVHELLRRLERLLLVVERLGELLDLAPLLRRRLGGEAVAAWATNRSRSVCVSASRSPSRLATTRLVGGMHLLRGLDLPGPQLGELRIPHRRRLRDQPVHLLGIAADPGPQRLDLGEPGARAPHML